MVHSQRPQRAGLWAFKDCARYCGQIGKESTICCGSFLEKHLRLIMDGAIMAVQTASYTAAMHTLTTQFDELRNAIEPGDARKKEAQKADDPVREHLETHDSFAEHHVHTFLYGSYRRHTAICDIKDVDLVVVTNHTTDDGPLDVLTTLKDSLAELYDGADLADQRRSIRVDRRFAR